jgi:hypothetical protein
VSRRVFSVEDDSYSADDAKAERAIKLRTLQGVRYAKAQAQLAAWRKRLKRAAKQVKRLERRVAYYSKTLGGKP